MKNIHTILSELGITIPEDKKAELDKAVAENYKTSAEFEKKVNRLTEDFNTEKKRADTAEETLKAFEGIDPANVKTQLEEANKKIKEAQEDAQKQIAERDYNMLWLRLWTISSLPLPPPVRQSKQIFAPTVPP